VLDADVTYRGAELAARGAAAAVTGAIPAFMVQGGDLVLPLGRQSDLGYEAQAGERGVTFLPTLVKWGTNLPNHPDSDQVFSYRARGRGRLTHPDVDTRPGLVGVLGRTRTDLLLSLEEPASSTAVALFLGVTPTAVNQHLRALARAGLLQTSRFGRYVLYERTALADALIAAS
jgi:DNA-binding transcriptional ArsR family regulator